MERMVNSITLPYADDLAFFHHVCLGSEVKAGESVVKGKLLMLVIPRRGVLFNILILALP